MRAHTTRAVLAGAFALLAVGCGRGDGTEDVATVKEIDVAQSVEDAGPFRAELTTTDDALGSDLMRMTGVVDPAVGAFDVEVVVGAGATPPEGAVDDFDLPGAPTFGLRSDGSSLWAHIGADDDRGWVALGDPGDLGAAVGTPLPDPTEVLDDLRGTLTFTEVGGDEVDGVATTHYRATAPAPDEADDEADEGGPGPGAEVWVDDQGRPRRVELDGTTMTFTDYGVPVAVVAPAVVDSDAGFAGLAGLDATTPRLTGDWSLLSSGSLGERPWEVWEAPATIGEVAVRCRTFELDAGADRPARPGLPGLPSGDDAPFGDDSPFGEAMAHLPFHDGAMGVCPSGLAGGAASSDPAVIALIDLWAQDRAAGLKVSDRFADRPVTVALADGSTVELPVDAAGIAVWDWSDAPAAVDELRLADGTVTCPVQGGEGSIAIVGVCVRA